MVVCKQLSLRLVERLTQFKIYTYPTIDLRKELNAFIIRVLEPDSFVVRPLRGEERVKCRGEERHGEARERSLEAPRRALFNRAEGEVVGGGEGEGRVPNGSGRGTGADMADRGHSGDCGRLKISMVIDRH